MAEYYYSQVAKVDYGIDTPNDFSVEGDDNAHGNEDTIHTEQFTKFAGQLGFEMKIEHTGTIHNATFCQIVFKTVNGNTFGYRKLDRSLLKLGWSKYDVLKGSRAAQELMRSKIGSFKSMYTYSTEIVKLCDLMLSKLTAHSAKVRAMAFEYEHMRPTMSISAGEWFDHKYGADIIKLRNLIELNGMYCEIDLLEYPTIFSGDYSPKIKNIHYNAVDYNLGRNIEYEFVKGCENTPPVDINHNIDRL